MAEAYGPTSCPSGYVLKSKLLHYPESQYGFILKLCHQSAKTIALTRLKTKVRFFPRLRDYTAEPTPCVKRSACSLKI